MPHTPKKWIEIVFWFVMLSLSFIAIGFILNAPAVQAQTTTIDQEKIIPACVPDVFSETEKHLFLNRKFVEEKQQQNGLVFMYYHTGKGTVLAVVFVAGDTNPYPLFYAFGTTEGPHVSYIDQVREGTCDGVVLYWTDPKLEV